MGHVISRVTKISIVAVLALGKRDGAVALALLSLFVAPPGCSSQRSIDLTFTQDEPHSDETARDDTEVTESDGSAPEAGLLGDELPAEVPADPLACFTYVEALCERFAECRRLPVVSEGCLSAAVGCSGLADGATASTEELLECAREYASFECDRILQGRRLRCLPPGTQGPGAECRTSLSCESLICDYEPELGRFCAARAEAGGACPTGTACTFGEQCVDGRCEPVPAPDFSNGNLPLGAEGDDCRDPHQCQEGLYCYFESDTYLGKCRPSPTAGEACGNTRGYDWALPRPAACDRDSYCVDDGCVALPRGGEPCAESTFVDQRPCAWGFYCSLDDQRCRPWKQTGEECTGSTLLSGLTGLPLDPECDPEQGARCSCADDAENCDQQLCRIRVSPGGECDFEFSACSFGSSCIDGFCDYVD